MEEQRGFKPQHGRVKAACCKKKKKKETAQKRDAQNGKAVVCGPEQIVTV